MEKDKEKAVEVKEEKAKEQEKARSLAEEVEVFSNEFGPYLDFPDLTQAQVTLSPFLSFLFL